MSEIPSDIEALVYEHYDSVFRFLWQLTRHRENAEDLTQQTFLKAQSRLHTFRGDASVRTWLHKVALREFTSWRRKKWFAGSLLRADTPSPDQYGLADEALVLSELLSHLKPALREAFILHEVQGLSVEEVARVTRSPVGTVKSRLHHAREQLQRHWDTSNKELSYEPQFKNS